MDKAIFVSLFVAFVAVVTALVLNFLKLPKPKRIENLCEWLKWAVTEAEKALGSGTGQLKLRYVYSLACQTFKWVPNILSFAEFTLLVDDALYWLRNQIDNNNALNNYVNGDSDDNK